MFGIESKKTLFRRILRVILFLLCLGGFLYQTFELVDLYWTYPTVVDIQQIEPSHVEMPAFSICNSLGYDFQKICQGFNSSPCMSGRFSKKKFVPDYCVNSCFNGEYPEDLKIVLFSKFMEEVELTFQDHENLRLKLEDYMKCTIEFAGQESKCDLENIMGSFYSTDDLPQYCYAIYSKWGNPYKNRTFVPKGAVMHFHFFLNASQRKDDTPMPKYTIPSSPFVQIAIHSPYFLPSPFLDGMSYFGGRAYEVRLKMNERHLLPPPYETNCTDYMSNWYARGGRGPINQMGAVQECRVNKTYDAVGCVPLSLDYPHTYKICKGCFIKHVNGPCKYSTFSEECGKLADNYTQPCYSVTYSVAKEDMVITTFEKRDIPFFHNEVFRKKRIAYDCEGNRMFRKECSTIDVYIHFDRYEITNLTYNPKFERLQLFGAIGGYMGMWLGVSFLTVYDFIGSLILLVRAQRKKGTTTKHFKMKRNKFGKNRKVSHHGIWLPKISKS